MGQRIVTSCNLWHFCIFMLMLLASACSAPKDKPGAEDAGANGTPIADAGPDKQVLVGQKLQLNGFGSSDPEKSELQYHWEIVKLPVGAELDLGDVSLPEISFRATQPGNYVLALHVMDKEELRSAPARIIITVTNSKPIARASYQGILEVGENITLDASASTDDDGHSLTYHWALITKPGLSQASLLDPTAKLASFIPDMVGAYVFHLMASDGFEDSETAILSFAIEQQGTTPPGQPPPKSKVAPVAKAGPDKVIHTTGIVELNGSGSYDPNGGSLNYDWKILNGPANSAKTLSLPSSAKPSFVVDIIGSYFIQLTVTNSVGLSHSDTLVVTDKHVGLLCADCHDGHDVEVPDASQHSADVPTGSWDCGRCHLTTEWGVIPGAIWEGIPEHKDIVSRCHDCHMQKFLDISATHPITSARCNACHTNNAWMPALKLEHSKAIGDCNNCHLTDKPLNHQPTDQQCNFCHEKTSWTSTRVYVHTDSALRCVECHDFDPKIQPMRHHFYSDHCNGCHTTVQWTPTYQTGHKYYFGGCQHCHDGTIATGKLDGHLEVSDQCHRCHLTTGWNPTYQFDHNETTQPCVVCHSNSLPFAVGN